MPLTIATPSTIAIAVRIVRLRAEQQALERDPGSPLRLRSCVARRPPLPTSRVGEIADDHAVGEEEDAVGDRAAAAASWVTINVVCP